MNSSATLTSSANLYAGSKLIQSNCNAENLAFLRCKKGDDEPSACLAEGRRVVGCVAATMDHLSTKCKESFESYRACLETTNLGFDKCRKEERLLTKCFNNTTAVDQTTQQEQQQQHHAVAPSTH